MLKSGPLLCPSERPEPSPLGTLGCKPASIGPLDAAATAAACDSAEGAGAVSPTVHNTSVKGCTYGAQLFMKRQQSCQRWARKRERESREIVCTRQLEREEEQAIKLGESATTRFSTHGGRDHTVPPRALLRPGLDTPVPFPPCPSEYDVPRRASSNALTGGDVSVGLSNALVNGREAVVPMSLQKQTSQQSD